MVKRLVSADNVTGQLPDLVISDLSKRYAELATNKRNPFTRLFYVDGFGAVGDGQTDDLAAFNICYAAMGEGDTMVLSPAKTYALGGKFTITETKPINIRGGGWTQRVSAFSTRGTKIVPTAAFSQPSADALVKVLASYCVLQGFAVEGKGAASGSVGILVEGIPGSHAHANTLDNIAVFGFGHGVMHGAYSDHTTLRGCRIAGNSHGVGLAKDNHFDFFHEGSLLDGNVISSVHLLSDAASVNSTFLRCHLGFSQYGILQDDTTNGNGFTGLTLIDSPIESASEQMIKIVNGGNIRVEGGYWLWNGTPTKAAFSIGVVNQGPIWISPRLEEQTKNPNSPAVVQVTGFTNFAVDVDTPLNGFAQKKIGGVYNTLPPGTSPVTPNGRIPYSTLVVTGNLTVAPPLFPEDGALIRLRFRGVNLGSTTATITLSSDANGFKFGATTPGPVTVTNATVTYVAAMFNGDTSKWDVLSVSSGY